MGCVQMIQLNLSNDPTALELRQEFQRLIDARTTATTLSERATVVMLQRRAVEIARQKITGSVDLHQKCASEIIERRKR